MLLVIALAAALGTGAWLYFRPREAVSPGNDPPVAANPAARPAPAGSRPTPGPTRRLIGRTTEMGTARLPQSRPDEPRPLRPTASLPTPGPGEIRLPQIASTSGGQQDWLGHWGARLEPLAQAVGKVFTDAAVRTAKAVEAERQRARGLWQASQGLSGSTQVTDLQKARSYLLEIRQTVPRHYWPTGLEKKIGDLEKRIRRLAEDVTFFGT